MNATLALLVEDVAPLPCSQVRGRGDQSNNKK